jgi:hypothetical protein
LYRNPIQSGRYNWTLLFGPGTDTIPLQCVLVLHDQCCSWVVVQFENHGTAIKV